MVGFLVRSVCPRSMATAEAAAAVNNDEDDEEDGDDDQQEEDVDDYDDEFLRHILLHSYLCPSSAKF